MDGIRDMENYRAVIELISDSLYVIRDVYDRKAFLASASSEIDKVSWQGISILLKDPILDMVNRLGDALSYAYAIKFLGGFDLDLAKSYMRELTLRIDELAEWAFDKVMALLEGALAAHRYNLMAESENALELALSLINSIPDRSDKSIALAYAIKVLTLKGRHDKAIDLIDSIYYEPKRIEAIYNVVDFIEETKLTNELIKVLEDKLSNFEIPIFRAKLAYRVAKRNPSTAKKFCKALLSRADFNRPLGIREIISYRWCIKSLIVAGDKSVIGDLHNYINALSLRLDEREAVKAIRDTVLEYYEAFGSENSLVDLVNKIVNQAITEENTNKYFILNRLANLKWYLGLRSDAIYMLKTNFMEANKQEYPVSAYTVMDIGVNALEIANNFPREISPESILVPEGTILPAERQSVEISISREHLKFLKSVSRGAIGVYIESLLNKESIERTLDLNKKAKEFMISLIRKGQQIVLHYVLKYIYELPMNEHERTNYLNLLGRAVELITSNRNENAIPYVELILDKLERAGYPLYAIPMELLHDYIMKLI